MVKPLLLSILVLGSGALYAQGAKSTGGHAEGLYLPVEGQAYIKGRKAGPCVVELFKDNVLMSPVQVDDKGAFLLELDLDQSYTVRIGKEGYESKLLLIDTSLPADVQKYAALDCSVELIPTGAAKSGEEFYADFPSTIIRWDPNTKEFLPSSTYLSHIQEKLGNMASVSF